MVTKNNNTEAIRNSHANPRVSKEFQWNALSNRRTIRDRNALEAVETAKEERNAHETKRTHITKNDNTKPKHLFHITKNDNTKPKHLFHANPSPPRRTPLKATSICALDREKQAWDQDVMTKRKTCKTTKNSPWPLHAIPTKKTLLPNTLSTSHSW